MRFVSALDFSSGCLTALGRREVEEKHREFDPASVNGLMTICQVQGTGAVSLN